MRRSASATCDYFGIGENSLLLCPLSADYIAGKMMIVRAIVSGAALIVEPPSNQPVKEDYDVIDLLPVVPSQIRHLVQSPDKIKRVRKLLIGGAALSPADEQSLLDACVDAYVSYGMTETCSHVALRRVGQSVYRPINGISFSVDNDGCLIVNAPEFSFKSLTTNDIVDLRDDNSFSWIGRRDNVINSGGIKVFPEIIEQKISPLLGADAKFYITKRHDPLWGESPVLVIERNSAVANLENSLAAILTPPERPKGIIVIETLPTTDNGKVLRRLP